MELEGRKVTVFSFRMSYFDRVYKDFLCIINRSTLFMSNDALVKSLKSSVTGLVKFSFNVFSFWTRGTYEHRKFISVSPSNIRQIFEYF